MSMIIVCLALVGLIAMVYFGQRIITYVVRKKIGEKQKLIGYRKRLNTAVGQLLAKANDIDERSHFLANKPSNSWSKQLSDACNQLVGLSSALKELEAVKEEPGQAKNNLLRAVAVAKAIDLSLQQLEEKLGQTAIAQESREAQ